MTPSSLTALLGLGLGLVAATPLLTAPLVTVSQRNRAFEVTELQIARGGAVRFNNDDDFPHQIAVRGPALQYESDLMAPRQSVELLFPDLGAFDVRCGIHPRMRMTVHVR